MSNCHAGLLNDLLRGELAAAQTYQRAMMLVGAIRGAAILRLIHDQHHAAVNTLCREIRYMGCEPEHDCDHQSDFEGMFQSIQNSFCDAQALAALRQGEVTGLHSYEEALQDQFLPGTSQTLIRTKLLPQIRKHIQFLEQLSP